MTMRPDAREMQGVAIKDLAAMLREVLDQAGLKFDEIDYVIPHQTSVRAMKEGDGGVVRGFRFSTEARGDHH